MQSLRFAFPLILGLCALALSCKGKTESPPDQGPAGIVLSVEGEARAIRDGKQRMLFAETPIFRDDTIHTGADSSLSIRIYHNNATWQIGANYEGQVDASLSWRAKRQKVSALQRSEHVATAAAGRNSEREAAESQENLRPIDELSPAIPAENNQPNSAVDFGSANTEVKVETARHPSSHRKGSRPKNKKSSDGAGAGSMDSGHGQVARKRKTGVFPRPVVSPPKSEPTPLPPQTLPPMAPGSVPAPPTSSAPELDRQDRSESAVQPPPPVSEQIVTQAHLRRWAKACNRRAKKSGRLVIRLRIQNHVIQILTIQGSGLEGIAQCVKTKIRASKRFGDVDLKTLVDLPSQ